MLGKGAGGDCVEAETAFLLASAAAVGERLKRLNGFCIAVKNDLAVSVADGLTGGLTVAWAVGFAVAGGAGFVFSTYLITYGLDVVIQFELSWVRT